MEGGPPSFPQGFTCPVVLRYLLMLLCFSPTGLSPSVAGLSRPVRLSFTVTLLEALQPHGFRHGLGSFPFARRYSGNRKFFLFLRVLRCFSSPGSLYPAYRFSWESLSMTSEGLPHSEISGSKPACGSPKLIAAYHVLHRLLAPRHPPCALCSLTFFSKSKFLSSSGLVRNCSPLSFFSMQLSRYTS